MGFMPTPPTVQQSVASVRQSMDEVVKPTLADLRERMEHVETQVDALNVKFYGVLIGGLGGAVAIFGKLQGWF